jgi:hypothetical protein
VNISDIWDWAFFWSMFRNFMTTIQPFVMIVVVCLVVPMLLKGLIGAIRSGGK